MPGRRRATSCGEKPLRGDGARPVALHEDVRLGHQRGQRLATGRLAQIDRRR